MIFINLKHKIDIIKLDTPTYTQLTGLSFWGVQLCSGAPEAYMAYPILICKVWLNVHTIFNAESIRAASEIFFHTKHFFTRSISSTLNF